MPVPLPCLVSLCVCPGSVSRCGGTGGGGKGCAGRGPGRVCWVVFCDSAAVCRHGCWEPCARFSYARGMVRRFAIWWRGTGMAVLGSCVRTEWNSFFDDRVLNSCLCAGALWIARTHRNDFAIFAFGLNSCLCVRAIHSACVRVGSRQIRIRSGIRLRETLSLIPDLRALASDQTREGIAGAQRGILDFGRKRESISVRARACALDRDHTRARSNARVRAVDGKAPML